MSIEKFGGFESNIDINVERVERIKNEIRNAMVMLNCVDMDGFDACMNEWLDKNDESYEQAFDKLLTLKPDFINEWDSADASKRDEIMDVLNGPIVVNEHKFDKAA
jgi:spermidine/putrescine-binding protein